MFGLQLHTALSARGWGSEIAALAAATDDGLAIDTLGPTRRDRRTVAELRRRAADADVVVAHGSTTLPLCAVALAASGTPFVYRNIGDPNHWVTSVRQRLQGYVLLRRPERLIALTATTAERMVAKYRLDRSRITVIPKGVPLDDFPPTTPDRRRAGRELLRVDNDRKLVVYLGALGPEKLIDNAIAAVEKMPDVHLAIVGDGAERSRLERLAAAVGPRIHLVGPTSQPALALAAADVVVLPSETEGLPGVLIEAGLVGVPVVATDVGFVSDIVADDRAGTLVPPHDVDGLRAALDRHLASSDPIPAEAQQALRDRYGLEQVVAAWDDVLGSVAAGYLLDRSWR